MKTIQLSTQDYNKVGQDIECDECEETFFVVFNWHGKFVRCECGAVYEVGFL